MCSHSKTEIKDGKLVCVTCGHVFDAEAADQYIGADWSPAKRGRALVFIYTLANTPHNEWRTKASIYAALAEFRKN